MEGGCPGAGSSISCGGGVPVDVLPGLWESGGCTHVLCCVFLGNRSAVLTVSGSAVGLASPWEGCGCGVGCAHGSCHPTGAPDPPWQLL